MTVADVSSYLGSGDSVSGLGDKANIVVDADGASLHFAKGDHALTILVAGGRQDPGDRDREACVGEAAMRQPRLIRPVRSPESLRARVSWCPTELPGHWAS